MPGLGWGMCIRTGFRDSCFGHTATKPYGIHIVPVPEGSSSSTCSLLVFCTLCMYLWHDLFAYCSNTVPKSPWGRHGGATHRIEHALGQACQATKSEFEPCRRRRITGCSPQMHVLQSRFLEHIVLLMRSLGQKGEMHSITMRCNFSEYLCGVLRNLGDF